MLDQNAFRETLHLVQEVAAASGQPMSREEALSYFKDMELTREQQELVYQFLLRPPETSDILQPPETSDMESSDEENADPAGKNDQAALARGGPKKGAGDNCTAHFQMYMRQVAGISRLGQEQEQLLYRRLLAGDKSVIEEISNQWLSRIVAMAREYQSGIYLDDLVQEGNIALLTALHDLAGKQEVQELEKRLVEAVMDAIEAYMGAETGARQEEDTILGKVSLLHEARQFLKVQSGEEPTMEELADYTRLDRQEISDIMELMEKAKKPS